MYIGALFFAHIIQIKLMQKICPSTYVCKDLSTSRNIASKYLEL